jgi:hypothetical protein
MNVFLLDLWHDLREKRMAPVAVVLAVALVAVLFVLRESPEAEAPATPPSASAPQDPGAELAVKALQESSLPSSDLGVFDPRDPFKPLGGGNKAAPSDGKAGVPAGGGDAKSSGGDAGAGSIEGGSETPSEGGGGSGGDGGGAPSAPDTKVVEYAYVVDLTFERDGRTRRIRGFKRLGMLPNRDAPLLIFLGVDSKASNAVFMVDSSLEANGEGSCRPNADDCGLLYLGAGEEHFFTDADGDSYGLRVDQIRKVKVSSSNASGASNKSSNATARTSTGRTERRRFLPPVLLDLVAVASPDDERSSNRRRGR